MLIKKQHIYIGVASVTTLAIVALIPLLKKRKKALAAKVDLSVFDSPDILGSGKCIDKRLIGMLLQLEKATGYPIFEWVNSGARSEAHNKRVGGVRNSAHKMPVCKAVDIKTSSRLIQKRLVATARKIGFKRIGIGKTFVHLDVDTTKSQYVAWGYPSGARPPFNPFG